MSTARRRRDGRAFIRRLMECKREGRRIVAMTAYDVVFARILEAAGVDLILVGDSVGPAALGYDSTNPVTMDEMIHHARAVKRGAPETLVVLDMPFMSYQVSVEDALANASRALKEAGVEAVKVEGGHERTCVAIRAMVASGIPVMGHVGPIPQSAHGRDDFLLPPGGEGGVDRVRAEARALEDAGVFSLVLDRVPAALAAEISAGLTVPTVGIGSGPGCDGQILVAYHALGLEPGAEAKSPVRFAALHEVALEGVRRFAQEVREGAFPGSEASSSGD